MRPRIVSKCTGSCRLIYADYARENGLVISLIVWPGKIGQGPKSPKMPKSGMSHIRKSIFSDHEISNRIEMHGE